MSPVTRKIRGIVLFQTSRQFLLAWLAVVVFGPPLHGQEIRVRALDARSGKPITKECLNVWIGALRGSALNAPTNNEGVAVLHIKDNVATADDVTSGGCSVNAGLRSRSIPNADTIFVAGGNYIACQEYGKIVPGEPVTPNLTEGLMPAYSIKKILESGVSAANTCGKFRSQERPGELIIFERHTTFWERLRE